MSGRPLRIMYPASLSPGGAERQQMLLAEYLPRDRFKVSFVMLLGMTEMGREAQALGVTVHALGAPRRMGQAMPSYAAKTAGRVAKYVALCRRERFDIVDAWLYLGYGLAAITRPISHVPVLIAGRRSLGGFKADFGLVERTVDAIARRSADIIVANAQAVADDAIRHEGLDPGCVRVIRNGVVIPPPFDDVRRRAARVQLGLPDDAAVIGCVGSFRRGKGQAALVSVMAEVRHHHPEVWLVFAGDGPDRATVEGAVRDSGLPRVRFLGTVQDARTLFDGFDVVVSASEAEGMPNVLLEAAAAGRPIAATSVGGTPEIVIDGRTGLLVPVGDARALGQAMIRLLDDPTLAKRLGRQAREHVSVTFGLERFVAETAALYEEMHRRHDD